MKKIGIITFHFVPNYGAVLQAFSLQESIKKISNYDVAIINFRPQIIQKNYEIYLFKKGMSLVKIFTNLLTYNLRKNKIKKFINFEKKYLSLSELDINEFDILICGSDQVWNPSISKLKEYYLNIITKAKKISYAASLGKDELSNDEINFLKSSLGYIDVFSLREDYAVNILKNLFPNKLIKQVLDPVFLKTSQEWKKMISNIPIFNNYILIYMMEFNHDLIEFAKQLSKETQKKIIFISPNANIKSIIKSLTMPGKVLFDLDPLDYLNIVLNADYICTNSFHGLAFSIIFKKKFITIPHSSRNNRLKCLLNLFALQSQEINIHKLSKKDKFALLFNYDSENTQKKLHQLRDESLNFLKEAIS